MGNEGTAADVGPVVEVKNLRFTYPGIDGHPPPGSAPLIDGFFLSLRAGDRCLLVYVAHGKLQLAVPLEKVKEMSNLSLMVSKYFCVKIDVK
ncbi:hypothetical protein B296_00030207 [Ensete ventricosum]|uniref:Uncharacterized protein n=1 Tax=Ensete ventricosum TaxID=4639 RepID=A0A427A937_ENSVE|nr:hypothetical protein B296_00030207 [Ensete ventricosum]